MLKLLRHMWEDEADLQHLRSGRLGRQGRQMRAMQKRVVPMTMPGPQGLHIGRAVEGSTFEDC